MLKIINIFSTNGIGQRIKQLRNKRGYSQDDMAEKFGCKRQTYAKLENGKKKLTAEEFAKLCDILECDAGYLFGEYSTERRITADIQAQTGLSEEAILALQNMNPKKIATTVLSSILTQPDIEQWFVQIYRIALERSACNSLKNAAYKESRTMENKKITTLAESARSSIVLPELESAELQESRHHYRVLEGVVSDLVRTNDNVKEYGKNSVENSITAYRKKYKLED